MKRSHHLSGEMKLTRPVSFRVPEPMYRSLVKNLNGERLSDLLRNMVFENYAGRIINQKQEYDVDT